MNTTTTTNNNNCKTNSSTTRNDNNYVQTTGTTNSRGYKSVIAVLNEQCNQRAEWLQIHGKVKEGIYDPNWLQTVYEKEGNTIENLQEAHYLAIYDEIHITEEYDNSREELESSSSSSLLKDDSSSSSYPYSPDDDNVHNINDDDHRHHLHHHHHHNIHNSCTILDNNIIHNNFLMKSLLQKLITPFVKVPSLGNMFVGINQTEYS